MSAIGEIEPKLDQAAVFPLVEDLRQKLQRTIRGKAEVIDNLIIALLVDESILVEDVPGVGKTTLAKALASSVQAQFQRVQCTPDLLPADIFGVSVFQPQEGRFEFRPGPVFCNILLVDEINRASPRTQSALLEAMAEHQVTVDGNTQPLPSPFMVIATQNPLGFQGTFSLPESQLDRFVMQISMEYPDREAELEILYQESGRKHRAGTGSVLTLEQIVQMQRVVEAVRFESSLANYLLDIVEATRTDGRVELGCSPRGSISFFRATKARAFLAGRDYVLPDDIQQMAAPVLQHRLVSGEGQSLGHQGTDRRWAAALVAELLEKIPVPV